MFPQTLHGNLKWNVPSTVVLLAFMAIAVPCFSATQTVDAQHSATQMTFRHAVSFAVSRPLRDLAKLPPTHHYGLEEHEQVQPNFHPGRVLGPAKDPAEQKSPGGPSSITTGLSIAGVSNVNNVFPSDVNAAVGDTQVVEWVNVSYAVYNKTTGAQEIGPFDGNLLWQALGGPCFDENGGDIIAQWDKVNHRWLLAQNFFDEEGEYQPPYYACVAVSTSADATGTYYEYQFPLTYFPDYPKWGIWPSGYFQTQNAELIGTGFEGSNVCAYNTAKLIVGDQSAEQICFQTTPHDFTLLPADVDSSTPPPANQDEFFIGSYDIDPMMNHLYLYSMHVDFANPSQSTFTGAGLADPITVPTYTPFCPNLLGRACIPQQQGSGLASLGDRLMYRLAYWNDGVSSHVLPNAGRLPSQHWYVNHVTTASGGQAGVRWYEFRAPVHTVTISNITLFQSGTFAPDSNYRWMGSIAQDKMGDIAMGYSLAGSTIWTSIGATGRVPTDPLGQMEAETVIVPGTGSQGEQNRWGDYSSMAIDADGCTFWYAQMYDTAPNSQDWQTRVVSMKFSGCH
jgi:hypothetical protein